MPRLHSSAVERKVVWLQGTAGFSLLFYLPGFYFGLLFLSHTNHTCIIVMFVSHYAPTIPKLLNSPCRKSQRDGSEFPPGQPSPIPPRVAQVWSTFLGSADAPMVPAGQAGC